MWPPASNTQREPSDFSPLRGCFSHHLCTPACIQLSQLGFPYRPLLKSKCAAQLEGDRLHTALCSSEAASTLPSQKAENQDYFWLEVPGMAAESFTFPLQGFISRAKPMSDVMSSL